MYADVIKFVPTLSRLKSLLKVCGEVKQTYFRIELPSVAKRTTENISKCVPTISRLIELSLNKHILEQSCQQLTNLKLKLFFFNVYPSISCPRKL